MLSVLKSDSLGHFLRRGLGKRKKKLNEPETHTHTHTYTDRLTDLPTDTDKAD